MIGRRITALFGFVWLLASLACAGPKPEDSHTPASEPDVAKAKSRWSYEIRVDEAIERMSLGLCIEGPRPLRLRTIDDAADFVVEARVRGGPALVREGQGFALETLGEHGCLDFEIDLDAALGAGGRDCMRHGDSVLIAPDRWLWYPARVPEDVEARARLILPEGVHATLPWPQRDDGWRALDPTSFGWNAWVVFAHRKPLAFMVGSTQFEVAVLEGPLAASDAGIEAWIRASANASVELHGAFPREHVAVAVIPTPAYGDEPVLFGVARRGGGGSVMLLLSETASDDQLPGEWVATHELLHLGMPLIDDAWMAEGFVTYYTDVLRARVGLLTEGDAEAQTTALLDNLARGFEHAHGRLRTLQYASDNMKSMGSYRRVYWGGAAIAFDIDVQLRHATGNRHGLDELIRSIAALAPEHQRLRASQLLARMDEQIAAWRDAGELEAEISITDIANGHLESHGPPASVASLAGLAVEFEDGEVKLLSEPAKEVQIRQSMFE